MMLGFLLNVAKGKSVIRASGRFPERILNIASTSGIFVSDVSRSGEDSITFCTGIKGGEKLLDANLEGLSVEILESYGIPVTFKKYKKRVLLCLLPIIFILSSYVFSLFIWSVEVEGGDKKLQEAVLDTISENGVFIGALKSKIDRYDIKRKTIMEIDKLAWMWVDIRGVTAKVKIRERKPHLDLIPINEPSDVIAMHSGLIEKMQVYCGVPLFKEGQSVQKGDVIVTGVFRSENENIPTYYHHAVADITLRLCESKTVIIPRKTVKKTPTGNKKSVYRVDFEKNNINFSLNSRILYKEYDKIEKKYALPFTGISLVKTTYVENSVSVSDTDIPKELSKRRETFLDSLSKNGMEIVSLNEEVIENENDVTVIFSADCRVKTDKEIPISTTGENINFKGEANGENS